MKQTARLKKLLFLPVVTYSAFALTNANANVSNTELNMHHPAVKSVLMSYYNASYEELNDCFVTNHKTNTGKHAFCLIPKAEVKTINEEPTLYLLVYGKPLNTELARATNGLGGLFTLSPLVPSSDIWHVTHSLPYINEGQAGFSQLQGLTLTQVGKNNYGWTGEIAYSGSGTSVKDWVMYASIDEVDNKTQTNIIKKVADINTYYEYNLTGNHGKLSIIDNPNTNQPHAKQTNQTWYPLLVEKINCDFEQPTEQNMASNIDNSISTSMTTTIPQCTAAEAVGSLYKYDGNTNEYVEVFND